MIKLVYGPKGFGKTQIIKNDTNTACETAKGNVVFITDKKGYSADIDLNVKCIFTEEYGVASAEAFAGFLSGVVAGNSDIEYVFIDGLKRVCGEDLNALKVICDSMKNLEKDGVNFEFTISAEKKELPAFLLELAN